MAEALAGGSDELSRRPLFTAIICTVSPLHQERYGMDLAFTLAAAGIPVSFYPMPILGATGTHHARRAAVVNNAEMLSATTVVQLAFPGAKVIHGGGPTAMNMNSGAYASNSPGGDAPARHAGPHGRLLRDAGLVRRAARPRPRSRGSRAPTRTPWP